MLLQDNAFAVHEYLDRVALVQPQRLPDGHRDHDPPQLVHAPDNAG